MVLLSDTSNMTGAVLWKRFQESMRQENMRQENMRPASSNKVHPVPSVFSVMSNLLKIFYYREDDRCVQGMVVYTTEKTDMNAINSTVLIYLMQPCCA